MKKIIIPVLVLLLCSVFTFSALAENSTVSVTATIAVSGELAKTTDGKDAACLNVEVSDLNSDGKFTIDEALTALHEQYCPDGNDGYASYDSQYGKSISKLWGDESAAFGYYINNASAMSVDDEVKTGDDIKAYVYTDKTNYSDMYTWFDTESFNQDSENVTLTLKGYEFDANFMPVEKAAVGAKVTLLMDGKEQSSAATDADGNVSFSISEAGAYTVLAMSGDETTIVPSYKSFTVDKSEKDDTSSSSDDKAESSSETSSAEPDETDSAAEDKDYTLYWIGGCVVVIIVCGIILYTRRKK